MRYLKFFFFASVLLVSCGGIAPRTADLLAKDYRTMNDVELQQYYRALNDQLGRETSAVHHSVGLVKKTLDDPSLVSLRDRWNEVREELQRREADR